MFIDTSRQIAETLYFSLSGVDALYSKDLRYVYCAFFPHLLYSFSTGVDLAAESLTGQGLLDELPTDWVKSELMETFRAVSIAIFVASPTDWVKSELMET